ncbi:MAG TPA: hypothetical protein VFN26_15545 [Candidatus Acidoferrum sp.]|nr:hypothetical protein [Candidatus Acidoferrum sp.]
MGFFVRLFEAIAVLIPDFLTLGLVVLAFFNLYCIGKTFHLGGALDTDSAFQVSLAIAYFVTLAINIIGSLLTPARSTITTVLQSKSRVEQARREPSPTAPRPQPVGHKNAVIES